MAVTRVGYVTHDNAGGGLNRTITPDGTIATGDWMVLVIAYFTVQTITPPSGWTFLYNSVATGTLNTAVLIKKRGSTDGSYTVNFSSGTVVSMALMWFRGAADTGWVTGTGRARSTTGSTLNNIADPITTTAANTLELVISTERTTATETDITSMTGATKWFYKAQNGTVLETIAIGYADRPTAGATSSVTIAYPNTQSSNGWAVQIGIPAIPQQMGLLGSIWTGTVEAPIHATKWNGTTESAVSSFDLYTGDYRISDLLSTSPFYIAHRGGGDNWPEHTFRSYSSAVNYGMKAIEVSTHITSDGVIICHHDPSTLRMTGTDLTIASSTKAQLDALTNTAAFTDNPSQNREPIPTLVSVLNAYAGNHVIFVEPKALGNSWRVNTLLPLLNSYANSTQRIIWKSYINAPEFANAKAAGYTTWGYILTADPAHTNNLGTLIPNPNIDLIGVQTSASDAFVTDVVSRANAVGKKVIMWEIHTIAERDRAVALGCVGMMTSNLWVVLPKFP